MKTLMLAAAAVAAMSFAALAGEMEGTVKEVNKDTKTITFEDGMSAMASDAMKLDGIMAGDKVKVMTDDAKMITDIKKM